MYPDESRFHEIERSGRFDASDPANIELIKRLQSANSSLLTPEHYSDITQAAGMGAGGVAGGLLGHAVGKKFEKKDEEKKAEDKGPPNYRPSQPIGPSCGNCSKFQAETGTCIKYATSVSPKYVCDGYEAKETIKPNDIMKAGNPPKLDLPDNPMGSGDYFKAGFFLRCAEEGLSPEDIECRAKQAADPTLISRITAALKGIGSGLSPVVGKATDVGLAAAVGAPVALGLGGGWLAGKLRNQSDVQDTDTIKAEGLLSEYRRLADEAEQKAHMKRLQDKHPGELIQLS